MLIGFDPEIAERFRSENRSAIFPETVFDQDRDRYWNDKIADRIEIRLAAILKPLLNQPTPFHEARRPCEGQITSPKRGYGNRSADRGAPSGAAGASQF